MIKNRNKEPQAGLKDHHQRETFRKLQQLLLERLLNETETLHLHSRLKSAANEAAALAWNSGFPLLVYPGLLAEKAHNVRIHNRRREHILRRSLPLMGESK